MAIMLLSEAPPGTTATLTVKVWGETGATVDHQTTVYLTSSQWPCQPVAFSQSPLVLPALPSNWAGPLVVVNSPETVAVMRHLPKTTWGRERKTFPPQFKGASIREGRHSSRSLSQLVTLHPRSRFQEAGRNAAGPHFLLFIQTRDLQPMG